MTSRTRPHGRPSTGPAPAAPAALAVLAGLAGLAAVACAEKGGDSAACADVPVVTWDTFGDAFITHHCQGCHASSTPERYGAPDDITFDTVDEVWALADRVLERAGSEPPTMPPAGGTSEDDRTRLSWWLSCAEPGT